MLQLDLLINVALLVAFSIVSGFIQNHWPRRTPTGILLQGVFFGTVAALGMLHPLNTGSGIFFDGRSVLLSLCALYFGSWAAVVAVIIAATFRTFLDSVGLVTGLLVILSSTGIGLLARYLFKPDLKPPSATGLYLFGIVVHLVMLALMFTLPSGIALEVFRTIGLPVMVLYPLATVLAGKLLSDMVKVDINKQALRESEETYRALVAGLPDLVMRFTRDGRHIYVSDKVEEVVDLPASEFLGKTNWELGFSETQCRIWDAAIQRVVETGEPFESEFTIEGKQGPKIFNWRLIPEFDEQGLVQSMISVSRDITEQRRLEQEYKQLFNEMLNGFAVHELICDEQGKPVDYRFLVVNPAFEQMTGLRAAAIIGKTVREVLPETEDYWLEIYGKVVASGEPAQFENYSRALGKHFEVTAFRPAPNQFACILHDITKRKQAEKSLRESEALLRESQSIAHIGSWELDWVSNRLTWSEGVNKVFGLPSGISSATYEAFLELVHPEDRAAVAAAYNASFSEGSSLYEIEHRIIRQDNQEVRVVYETCEHVRDASGQVIRSIGMVQDITEHKQVENEIRERDAFLAGLLNTIPIPVFHKDREGRYQAANSAFLIFLGETRERVIGKTVFDINPSEYATVFHAKDLELMEIGGVQQYEAQVVNRREETRDVVFYKAAMTDSQGLVVGLVGAILDITERKQAEEERATLQAQLLQSQKLESVGRLAGGVAHDYNNMLSVILGYADLAKGRLAPGDPLEDDLQEIIGAAERSADITRQLLAFASKQTIAPKLANINELIENMLKMLRRLIGENIELSWLPGVNLGPVQIDLSQFDQILANLCVNARDAITGVGKITIETTRVTLDTTYDAGHVESRPGDFVQLAVSDDGCGMDAETLGRVFEPFFTTKAKDKGTGLGLATVYGIVRQNNGFINIYSEPGQGTTFKIYLPCQVGEVAAVEEEGAIATPIGGAETVLLVEDEPAILKMAETMLEILGYRVLAASTPLEALRLAGEHAGDISLLLTDVIMPQMDGHELTEQLQVVCPGLKTLYMSGYTAEVIAHRGVLQPGVAFLQKPFALRDLAFKVRAVLEQP